MKPGKIALGVLSFLFLGVAGVSASAQANLDKLSESTQSKTSLSTASAVWEQVNAPGFGDRDAGEVSALAAFNGYLYAGTSNSIDGARIFRSPDGTTWTPVTQPGFGEPHDIVPPAILDLAVFNGRLYASTGRGGNPAQIWTSLNGTTWWRIVTYGFGDPDLVDITSFNEYDGLIYAGAAHRLTGAQIWRSYTGGDSNTWEKAAPDTPGTGAGSVTGLAVFKSELFAAVESEGPVQIWSSFGGPWTALVSDGFGSSPTTSAGGLAEFGGYLYAGAGNSEVGAQLWRTTDGESWEGVIQPGFDDPHNRKVEIVFSTPGFLYAGVKNTVTGLELWRSADGVHWEQANPDGFGDKDNSGSNCNNAVAEFLGDLYVGTANGVDGGEVWRLRQGPTQPPAAEPKLYLPLLHRWP